jgi:CRP-like cAMP-binding protein
MEAYVGTGDSGMAATTIDDRALMVTERERLAFLEGVPMLRGVDDRTLRALARLGHEELLPGRSIVDSGAGGGTVYLVRSGELLVSTSAPRHGEWTDRDGLVRTSTGERVPIDPVTGGRVVDRLVPGAVFGDSTLVPDHLRDCTLRAALDGVEVVAFDALDFHLQLARTLLACAELASFAADESIDLRRVGLYNDLPMRELSIVLRDARQDAFRPGDAIVTAGDVGDRFYVVLDGEAIVERDGVELARLGRGDHFGELALLLDAPRAATVRATAYMRCWSVTREAFEAILQHRLCPSGDATLRDLREGNGPGGAYGSPLAARLRGRR